MSRGWQGVVLKALGASEHLLAVVSTSAPAPRVRRVRFLASTLFQQVRPEPATWLRFWFPDPDSGRREFQRAYTIAAADEATGELDVDFVLHEPGGPASEWAATAAAGDRIAVMSMGSTPFRLLRERSGVLLAGDPSSLPAINAIVASLPSEVDVDVVLEHDHGDDELVPLAAHPRLELRRTAREGDDSLAGALAGRDWSGWQVWAAGESGSMKAVRRLLRSNSGVARSDVHAQAYWIEGRAMGTARGTGRETP
ncbi:siderophore-interacting protein [Saccharopolyspora erythraea]|uniref:siderophore-interacting protein n=1 Tax=Saccharopolyspora erythraea TaxID=1836 RepID=UPI001BA75FF7|nr:siderophore-interacting protein [Saccharopolyspora erythraea]QUH03626.1 siderophore-interacting protein [Saccharopolyspora erythraea]